MNLICRNFATAFIKNSFVATFFASLFYLSAFSAESFAQPKPLKPQTSGDIIATIIYSEQAANNQFSPFSASFSTNTISSIVRNIDRGRTINFQEINPLFFSEPYRLAIISYGDQVFSENNIQNNQSGFAALKLKNENGDDIEIKVKLRDIKIYFDEYGQLQIKFDSELKVAKDQPNGNYNGQYNVIMSY